MPGVRRKVEGIPKSRGLSRQPQPFPALLGNLPLVSREWKNGSNSSYNSTPFLHSLLTKGKGNCSALKSSAAKKALNTVRSSRLLT